MSVSERVSLRDAFLLHRRAYRETSLLLDVLTPDFGSFRLIAKGALRSRGNRFAVLQPFVPLTISWAGRSELPVLCGAESRGNAFRLERKALFCGLYLNELLLRLLPAYDPHPGIFSLYEASLRRLGAGQSLDETLRFFELALLEEIGYGLVLTHEIGSGAQIRADGFYVYLIEKGPKESPAGTESVRGSTLLGLRDGHLPGPIETNEAKRLMRRVINHYLGGRPLKSRELFKHAKSN
jgi:DNA repair protein RecO (recombination protein O)